MESRTRLIFFRHPFTLPGLNGLQPPGGYVMRMEEPSAIGLSSAGWRTVRCFLGPFRGGTAEYVLVNAQDVREALVRDGDQGTDPPAAPASARAMRAPARRRGR